MLDMTKFEEARERIAPYIRETPLLRLPNLDDALGCEVYAKLETMQVTGSFKIRGALNKVLQLTDEEKARGIVAVSSGNHGKAVAHVARELGIPATVVIPRGAAPVKVEAIAAAGAKVERNSVEERFAVAERISAETGAVLVLPFNDEDIMAGQGTISLEIAEQLPTVDAIVCPVSGGGLLGGVSTAARAVLSNARVFGAEPAGRPRWSTSLAAGHPVKVPAGATLADALVALEPGRVCFPYVQANAERVVPVGDDSLLRAARLLLGEGKLLSEYSSCIGIAAAMEGLFPFKNRQKVCFVISGGNIALEQLTLLRTDL